MSPFTHPDWNALLAGIVAHPDDDLRRLVAADWLEEHGEEARAAFIRLQVERASNDRPELRWEEERFRNSPEWLPVWAEEACPNLVRWEVSGGFGLRGMAWVGVEKVRFRRGFPEWVGCTADEWQRYGELIVPRQPVREVLLRECREVGLDWWAMLATLRHLQRLALDDGDYRTLKFLRDQLERHGVDVVRHAPAPPTVPAAPPTAATGTGEPSPSAPTLPVPERLPYPRPIP